MTPLALVVLTFNEEANLEACLASVAGLATELHVVDSGSEDRTLEIAARYGARVASHAFETHARQWAWALGNLPIAADWVLALDADQSVTPELADALRAFLAAPPAGVAGVYVARRQVFRGTWIRHGGYYPKYLLKLFRRESVVVDTGDLVDHHFGVTGRTAIVPGDLVEANRKEDEIAVWTAKHNRYAVLQAREEMRRLADGSAGGRLLGNPDERVLFLKGIWRRLPLYVRPALYFVYRYVLRLGFLDGKEGLVFHFLQGFWYRFLVDVNLDEIRSREARSSGESQPR